MTRPIIAIDCETDPFKRGRIPQPFIWGYYDGKLFQYTEELDVLIGWLRSQECVVYAHNGGKFDYHYLLDFLSAFDDLLIINGRISKFTIGLAEFRDSYSIIPTALRNFEKSDFDYRLLEKSVRYKTENWRLIIQYLQSDCINLYNMVSTFIERYGLNLTQAGTAMKQWEKLYDRKPPRSTAAYYAELSRFYYGGRVQCFQRGIIEEPFSVIDINSAYPRAMLDEHAIGTEYAVTPGDIPHDHPHYAASFFQITAASTGVFPARAENGALHFPDDGFVREFFVTGWELVAARDTGFAVDVSVMQSYVFTEFADFSEYILKFYEERQEAKRTGDKAGDLFSKLLMNSLYGKFGSNPLEYENYMIIPHDRIDVLDGGIYRFAGELGPWILTGSELHEEDKRFYNVATSASITGWVRAYLWRALVDCGLDNVLYCDTDSIVTHRIGNKISMGANLGEWKHEGDFDRAGIGGKKLYIFRGVPDSNNRRTYKTASKGAKLTRQQLWAIARGESVTYRPENPSYSVHNGIGFVDRKISMTY